MSRKESAVPMSSWSGMPTNSSLALTGTMPDVKVLAN